MRGDTSPNFPFIEIATLVTYDIGTQVQQPVFCFLSHANHGEFSHGERPVTS